MMRAIQICRYHIHQCRVRCATHVFSSVIYQKPLLDLERTVHVACLDAYDSLVEALGF